MQHTTRALDNLDGLALLDSARKLDLQHTHTVRYRFHQALNLRLLLGGIN